MAKVSTYICTYLTGTFNLGVRVEHLLFVGPQLVALSGAGSRSKAGVWHTSTQHWQTQDVAHLTTYDTAGSFLLLGTATGAINYIGMSSFNPRCKNRDVISLTSRSVCVCLWHRIYSQNRTLELVVEFFNFHYKFHF